MSTKRKKKCSPTVRQQQRLTAMLRSLSSSWSALRDDKPLIEQHGFERDMAMLAGPEGHVIAGHVIEALFLASLYPLPNDVVTNIDWRWELVDFARNRCEVVIGRDMERDLRIMEKVIPSSMDYNPTMETLKQFWLRRDMPGQEVLWRLERRGFVPVSARELIGAYPGIVESGFCAVALGAVFCEAFLSASREGLKFMQPIKRGTIILAKPKMA